MLHSFLLVWELYPKHHSSLLTSTLLSLLLTILSSIQLLHSLYILDLQDHTSKLHSWKMAWDSFLSLWRILRTSLQVSIPHPRHHSSWTGALLPFLLGYFFIAGRFCINDVTQQCHTTALCLRPLSFFESIVILFFIFDSFLNCHYLFFETTLILLFL